MHWELIEEGAFVYEKLTYNLYVLLELKLSVDVIIFLVLVSFISAGVITLTYKD